MIKNMNRKPIILTLVFAALFGTLIGAYAGTVGVNDLFGFTNGYGFTWFNSTNFDATEYYYGGANYTRFIETLIPNFDQDLNTTDSVTFDNVTVSDELLLEGLAWNRWPNIALGSTAYAGFNTNHTIYDNYFLCDGASDGAQLQNGLQYLFDNGGGTYYLENGVYDLDDTNFNLTNPTNETIIIQGEGWGQAEFNLAAGNGTILHFTAPYGFVDVDLGNTNFGQLIIKDLGIHFTGNYAGGNRPVLIRHHVPHWENVRISINCGIPNNGIFFVIGSTGPPAETFSYKNVQWIDRRTSGNFTFLARLYGEMIELEDCSLITDVRNTSSQGFTGPLVTPRLFRLNQVTSSTIRNFVIFTGDGFDGDGTQYEHQWFYGDPADAHWYFDNSEFFASSDISGGHLSTSNGTIWVHGTFPVLAEGGTTPIRVTLNGTGTIYNRFIGDGYTTSGSAIIPNGEDSIAINHTLVWTPTSVGAIGTTADTNALIATTLGTTTFNITAAGNVGGNRTVYYWAAYNPVG